MKKYLLLIAVSFAGLFFNSCESINNDNELLYNTIFYYYSSKDSNNDSMLLFLDDNTCERLDGNGTEVDYKFTLIGSTLKLKSIETKLEVTAEYNHNTITFMGKVYEKTVTF